MDWLQWIPTPLRPSRKIAEARRRKQAQRRKGKPLVSESLMGRPLVFQTAANLCVCHPTGATLASPVLLGLGDSAQPQGSAHLTSELLGECQRIAEAQLLQPSSHPGLSLPVQPTETGTAQDQYRGPIALLREAYEATASSGSTTVALAALDNSTVIHGQLHPMVAMLSLGGCELLQLRRNSCNKREQPLPSEDAHLDAAESCGEASPRRAEEWAAASQPEDRNHRASSERSTPDGTESAGSIGSGTDRSQFPAGELEIVFRAQPAKRCEAAGESVVLSRADLDTKAEVANALEAIESQSSVQCASAREGDIVILVGAGLAANSDINSYVALCNEMLPSTPGSDFSPTPPELLRKLAHCIAEEAADVDQSELGAEAASTGNASTPTKGLVIPASVVVAEVVEWVADDSGSSSSSGATPEKVDAKAIGVLPASEERKMKLGVTPVLEGLDDMKAFQCMMGFGDYGVSFSVDVPKVEVPKWPPRRIPRTLTNDVMGDLD